MVSGIVNIAINAKKRDNVSQAKVGKFIIYMYMFVLCIVVKFLFYVWHVVNLQSADVHVARLKRLISLRYICDCRL